MTTTTYTDADVLEAKKFWGFLERLLERDPDADDISDLFGQYKELSDIIAADAAENPEHHDMLQTAHAIERDG